MALCKIGRNYDPNHPTCRSCERQGIVCQKPKKAKLSDLVKTWHAGKVLMTTAYLPSSNHWHGRPRYVYLQERKKWEQILVGTWALWGVQGEDKRTLLVRRFVSNQNSMILDYDNRVAAIKPLKDTLIKVGVLKDDTDEFCAFQVEQFIDSSNPRTEIEVM